MGEVQLRVTGVVIPFAPPRKRAARTPLVIDANARGEILLFTGVRYERMPEPTLKPASDDRVGGGRRRRRS